MKSLWAGLGLLAVGAALSNTLLFRQSVQGNSDLTRHIPTQLGRWVLVEEVPASPSEVRGLETNDIVKRTYSDGREMVNLVVAHIPHSSRKSAHAQEACLRGAGAMVGRIETRRLGKTAVEARSISLDLQDHRQQVYYWYKMGNRHAAGYLGSSLRMFLGGLSGGNKPQGTSLVRLLTPVRRGEAENLVDQRLEDFSASLVPELDRLLP